MEYDLYKFGNYLLFIEYVIIKYVFQLTLAGDWTGLHKEQVNASRTVQQVKATLRELERTRQQVVDEDVEKFDRSLEEIKNQTVMAVKMFVQISQVDEFQPAMIGDILP